MFRDRLGVFVCASALRDCPASREATGKIMYGVQLGGTATASSSEPMMAEIPCKRFVPTT